MPSMNFVRETNIFEKIYYFIIFQRFRNEYVYGDFSIRKEVIIYHEYF